MATTIRIKGFDRLVAKFEKLPSDVRKQMTTVVYAAVDMIRVEAVRSIVHGAIQGAGHVPSAPGEPPNRDTGQLDTSIVTERKGELAATVTANSPYAAALEFGTERMAERPYMRPAIKKKTTDMVKLIEKALNKACKNAGA